MTLQFDAHQPFQRDAIDAVADLFEGQPHERDTQADEEIYDLIMKAEERLLSLDEPLRFSAARGWDNPNVFQI